MKATRLAAAALAVVCAAGAYAQQDCDIDLAIANITKGNVVPENVEHKLEAKLTNALAKSGIVAAPYDAQFFIAGRFDDAFNDITGGPSQKVIVKTTLTLYIGDAQHQKVFASQSFDLKGVGGSDEQAYTRALGALNPSNPKLVEFIRQGRDKIIDYFNANYGQYLDNARRAMKNRDYDQALFYATSIPSCCVGYDQAQKLAMQIYTDNTNYMADQLLAQAQAAWAEDPTEAGARRANQYLTQIDPASKAAAGARALTQTMSKTTKQQWEFENVQKHKDAVSLERERMRAAKEVAVAWAKSRPRTVNRYVFIRSRY